jgi:hypothetical protein
MAPSHIPTSTKLDDAEPQSAVIGMFKEREALDGFPVSTLQSLTLPP